MHPTSQQIQAFPGEPNTKQASTPTKPPHREHPNSLNNIQTSSTAHPHLAVVTVEQCLRASQQRRHQRKLAGACAATRHGRRPLAVGRPPNMRALHAIWEQQREVHTECRSCEDGRGLHSTRAAGGEVWVSLRYGTVLVWYSACTESASA
eukprot:356778-Chlamydomonas_euryale.AAC.13